MLKERGATFKATEQPVDTKSAAGKAFPVSYTHLRAHETVLDLVCRLLLEKKNNPQTQISTTDQKQTVNYTTSETQR